ncbi:AzlC family ABC transporter permease [Leadbettera azotonutricia]|uniref:Branched-chain amino acid transport protein AzlC n=1 Tax=Leadbettera azotonutricia (strain ATCC BAA-888 / DSM 13862 / ZAS-9) TaxID=545695 RepID=F5YFJ9_LEAAZ|nr:AzlC family ABC transporter permease [Leadbettera azotonutricia]AEF83079.1 branched-chain amino acid transport protein AzlC [Leadbettera azotonutricia ZAS-9]
MSRLQFNSRLFKAAVKYSIPVLLGYATIGIAFGLLLVNAGYPWWLSLVMSLVLYAGAGQFMAIGLFAAGTTLWEICLMELVLNARHMAYGLSMLKRLPGKGFMRLYCIFGLTDETFALLSSLPQGDDADAGIIPPGSDRDLFMFYVTLLDQFYWVSGSVIGAAAGSLIPFNFEGIGFALTALFVVLLIEQILRVKKPHVFVISGLVTVLSVIFIPGRFSLLTAMALSLALVSLLGQTGKGEKA